MSGSVSSNLLNLLIGLIPTLFSKKSLILENPANHLGWWKVINQFISFVDSDIFADFQRLVA